MHSELTDLTKKISQYSDRHLSKISQQDLDSVRSLIANYVEQLISKFGVKESRNIFEESANNILHVAAKFGDAAQIKKVVEFVLDNDENGANGSSYYVNLRDDKFFTPLHYAAKNGWLDVVKLLLEYGAEKNPKVSEQDRAWTPIHYAAKGGYLEIVKTLISAGVDQETKTMFGLTPLVVAAEFGHAELLQFLLKSGANKNVTTIQENHGMTALHYGAVGGYSDVVALLVKEGANKEIKTTSGLSALHLAVSCGSIEVAEILLKNGSNIFDKTPSDLNVLYLAASKSQSEMVSFLLQWGIDELDEALKVAKSHSNKEIVQKIELYQKAIKNLFNLKNLPTDLGMILQNFTKQNLHEARVILEEGVSFNGYGISNLKQTIGIFNKETITLAESAEKKRAFGLADTLRSLSKTVVLRN